MSTARHEGARCALPVSQPVSPPRAKPRNTGKICGLFRRMSLVTVRFIESSRLPTKWGEFHIHGFEDTESNKEHVVLTMGDVSDGQPVLVRVHSECLTGDGLFSLRCDCGTQLEVALEAIAREGRGALFYLRQEGRGIGLLNKIKAYKLQDAGADTVEANERLGFGADMRDYSILVPMIEHLGVTAVRLMTITRAKWRRWMKWASL